MRGWTDIGSDASWDEHGGRWAKRAADGSWYVVRFDNMYEACGEDECKRDGQDQYVCEVERVDLSDLGDDTLASALRCCGFTKDIDGFIYDDSGNEIASPKDETRFYLVLVEACVSYGAKQPLDSFSGNVRPSNVRANARRAAEALMRDATALGERLDRPVNAIGATAREYARGEIAAPLARMPEGPTKSILTKMVGMPTLGGGTFGDK
jgi:hypothetical protein